MLKNAHENVNPLIAPSSLKCLRASACSHQTPMHRDAALHSYQNAQPAEERARHCPCDPHNADTPVRMRFFQRSLQVTRPSTRFLNLKTIKGVPSYSTQRNSFHTTPIFLINETTMPAANNPTITDNEMETGNAERPTALAIKILLPIKIRTNAKAYFK